MKLKYLKPTFFEKVALTRMYSPFSFDLIIAVCSYAVISAFISEAPIIILIILIVFLIILINMSLKRVLESYFSKLERLNEEYIENMFIEDFKEEEKNENEKLH
jgi:ABC-type transport system involved in cytochrome bd biosynthesis fused ATPase/permease subunit